MTSTSPAVEGDIVVVPYPSGDLMALAMVLFGIRKRLGLVRTLVVMGILAVAGVVGLALANWLGRPGPAPVPPTGVQPMAAWPARAPPRYRP